MALLSSVKKTRPGADAPGLFGGCLFGIFEREFGVQHSLDTGDPVVVTKVDGFDALGAAAAGAVSYD